MSTLRIMTGAVVQKIRWQWRLLGKIRRSAVNAKAWRLWDPNRWLLRLLKVVLKVAGPKSEWLLWMSSPISQLCEISPGWSSFEGTIAQQGRQASLIAAQWDKVSLCQQWFGMIRIPQDKPRFRSCSCSHIGRFRRRRKGVGLVGDCGKEREREASAKHNKHSSSHSHAVSWCIARTSRTWHWWSSFSQWCRSFSTFGQGLTARWWRLATLQSHSNDSIESKAQWIWDQKYREASLRIEWIRWDTMR